MARDQNLDPPALSLHAIHYAQLEDDKCGWKQIQVRIDVQDIVNGLQHHKEFGTL